jgi:DNA primase
LLVFLQEQEFTQEQIIKYGLAKTVKKKDQEIPIVKDSFWKGLAIFPVLDHDGNVISFTCKDPQKKYPGLMLQGVIKKWFLNYSALGKHTETFIVEGENDLASLLDVGIENVVGTAGAPGQEQVVLLKNFCSGKTLYLWFDKDEQKDFKKYSGGAHHIEFLYARLKDTDIKVRMILHPGKEKDPDEFIQGLLKAGKKETEIKKIIRDLKDDAVDPLMWELEQLKNIPETKDRLEAFKLRKLPQALNAINTTADQEVYIALAAKSIGITIKAVEELVNQAVDLYKNISDAFSGKEGIKKAEPLVLAEFIYKWFNNGAGARFFKTQDKKVYLFYQRKIYEIGNNLEFNTLMQQLTRLAAIEKPGTTVWYFMQTLCNQYGEHVDLMSWMYTDRERDTVYVNLNSSHNKIIRIAPEEDPAVIDNGTNEHSILLSLSPQIRQFEYQQNASEAEGFAALKTLLMDTTPCEVAQKYFLICWTISTFMMNYQSDRGLLQIIASSKLGKSKVAERISQLFYGESYVGKGTGAAETRVATANPIIFLDNVENRNLTQGFVDFLLLLANSSHKPKAKSGSDTDVMYQKLFTMAIITSIEAFPGKIPELVNRTFPLQLESQYKLTGYMHDEIMREISKKRNLIISVILQMIAKQVLPRLSERTDWSKYIQTKFAGHDKDRNNEHICTMMVILEALLEHIPKKASKPIKTQASEILDKWITYWNEQESETALSSNTLLTLMDGLTKEICIKLRGRTDIDWQDHSEFFTPYPNFCDNNLPEGKGMQVMIFDDPEYLQRFFLTESHEEPGEDEGIFMENIQRFEFIITSAELHILLNRYCANQHIRNPYETVNSLGARISNDKPIMEKGGWQYIQRSNDRISYKKVGGHHHWRFSKKIRAII